MHSKQKNNLKILIDECALELRIRKLVEELRENYRSSLPHFVVVLEGANKFFETLESIFEKEYSESLSKSFIKVKSYVKGKSYSPKIILQSGKLPDRKKGILVIEDIIDTGKTLLFLRNYFLEKGFSDIKLCTLLDKPENRQVNIKADYVGFTVPNEFIVGYGIDYDGKYRDLSYIASVDVEI